MWLVVASIILVVIIVMIIIAVRSRQNLVIVEDYSDEKWVAAIIEPRDHPDLNYVIKTFREKLRPSIEIVVFYGKGRTSLLEQITKDLRNVTLVELDKDNFDAKGYNDFVKSMEFWKHINGQHLLIFQTDSMLCSNSPYTLEDFESFSFIGARTPWDFKLPGGNGGLSVRDVNLSKECVMDLESGKLNKLKKYGEDGFFARCAKKKGAKLPVILDKDRFAAQNYFTQASFGGHQVSAQLSGSDLERFYQYCPEYLRTMK